MHDTRMSDQIKQRGAEFAQHYARLPLQYHNRLTNIKGEEGRDPVSSTAFRFLPNHPFPHCLRGGLTLRRITKFASM